MDEEGRRLGTVRQSGAIGECWRPPGFAQSQHVCVILPHANVVFQTLFLFSYLGIIYAYRLSPAYRIM